MRKIILTAMAFMAIACTNQQPQTHNKFVKPLPPTDNIDELDWATVPAEFTADDFEWKEGYLTMSIYYENLYDFKDIASLKSGDTLLWDDKTIIVNEIVQNGELTIINKGLEEGGADLLANGEEYFRAIQMDDHSIYSKLGKTKIGVNEDFIIIDCGVNPDDPNDTIQSNQHEYIKSLSDSRRDFNCLNTTVTIEKGLVSKITRRWIP